MTFCLEEGLNKLKSLKEYEDKHASQPQLLTKEDKDNYK
jgi:hypothetical protein